MSHQTNQTQFANVESGESPVNTTSPPPIPHRSHSERLPNRRFHASSYDGKDHDLPPLPPQDQLLTSLRHQADVNDRKRRLTTSAETGRRRTTTGGFTSSDNHYRPSPRRDSAGSDNRMAEREVIDLTSSSPVRTQTESRPSPRHRTTSSNSRGYNLPRWQPDHEVNDCPICKRPFSFLFRRHHCRKCGRVVCNECSPHRITIPRQYIVHPPGTLEEPLSPSDIPTIDLTRVDDDGFGMRRNSALGGGEKVRLCNPCVPDPQPELLDMLREGPTSFPTGPTRRPSITRLDVPGSHPASNRIPSFGQQHHAHMPHPGTRVSFAHRDDVHPGSTIFVRPQYPVRKFNDYWL